MPLQLVDVGKLILTSPVDGLQLHMASTAGFHVPDVVSGLDSNALVGALKAGRLWVTRAVACSLDVQVRFNGEDLAKEWRLHLLESLGYGIRDLEIWARLSLAALLSITQLNSSPEYQEFSIYLQNSSAGPHVNTSRACLLERPDVIPPDSVVCAKFEGLQIQLNFSTPSRHSKRLKIIKHGSMLMDTSAPRCSTGATDLERVVDDMQNLSSSIAKCFEPSTALGSTRLPPSRIHKLDVAFMHTNSIIPNAKAKQPPWITDIVQEWINQHTRGTRLRGSERQSILTKTGLTSAQLTYLTTRLRRLTAPANNEEMLLDVADCLALEAESEDDMLLTFENESTPSLNSIFSTLTSSLSSAASKRPLVKEQTDPGTDFSLAYSSSASVLSMIGMRVLIAGCVRPNHSGLNGVHVKKPPPEASMAALVPTMFNPGYMQSISHNARYLPSISNVISQSLPRNVQSPSLRRKLLQLSNQPLSTLTNIGASAATTCSFNRLSAVVQSRLWTTMHNALYDPNSSKRLWKTSDPEGTKEDVEGLTIAPSKNADFTDDMSLLLADDEDFYDLFDGSDDGNILDDITEAERERLEVERETDEMLLGNDWAEWDPDEEALLSGGSDTEGMLL